MRVAIIPARGGSKRIPRKNIADFCGSPMISYSINAAKNSKIFDRVVVSTDDQEISEIALKFGAEVPFKRPKNISDDLTPTLPVVHHAIHMIEKDGITVDEICCIYPCSPLLLSEDLRKSLDEMIKSRSKSCIPVSRFQSAPQRAFLMSKTKSLKWADAKFKLTRTQDLEIMFHDIGSFYWATRDKWLSGDISNGIGYEVPAWRTSDIDDLDDWKRAEVIYKSIKKQN